MSGRAAASLLKSERTPKSAHGDTYIKVTPDGSIDIGGGSKAYQPERNLAYQVLAGTGHRLESEQSNPTHASLTAALYNAVQQPGYVPAAALQASLQQVIESAPPRDGQLAVTDMVSNDTPLRHVTEKEWVEAHQSLREVIGMRQAERALSDQLVSAEKFKGQVTRVDVASASGTDAPLGDAALDAAESKSKELIISNLEAEVLELHRELRALRKLTGQQAVVCPASAAKGNQSTHAELLDLHRELRQLHVCSKGLAAPADRATTRKAEDLEDDNNNNNNDNNNNNNNDNNNNNMPPINLNFNLNMNNLPLLPSTGVPATGSGESGSGACPIMVNNINNQPNTGNYMD